VGFIIEEASGETGGGAADVTAGDDPEEGGTGVTDLHDSGRPDAKKASRIQDKVIPSFILTFLSPDIDSFALSKLPKP
jgi:hypothetical protein